MNLNFSRPGGQAIAQYYTFVRLGRAGYAKVHNTSYAVARHIASEVARAGPFTLVFDAEAHRGIPVVTWRLTDDAGFSLFDLAERLRMGGWLVPAYTLPAELTDVAVQRVVVRHGFSLDMADAMLTDFTRSLEVLRRRPPSRPLGGAEGAGFNHQATPAVPTVRLGQGGGASSP